MRRVVLIGANGQLGTDLGKALPSHNFELISLVRADFDIRNHSEVSQALTAIRPDVIVNTAAFHKVEACEADPEQAFAVNCTAIRNLALVAERLGAGLVQISTDYVFDGEAGVSYSESAVPNPVNVYGTSKLAGEYFVRSRCSRHLIVRTSGLYGVAGSSGKGGNFVQTMLRLGREESGVSVVNDQVLAPTYTADLAQMIWRLVADDANGLYHLTSAGSCSWFEFARSIFKLSGLSTEVRPIRTAELGAMVRRPAYSALANTRLTTEGYEPLPAWSDGLKRYLDAAGAIAGAQPNSARTGATNAER